MAHQRIRHLLSILQKRLKLWPIVGVLGPRQVGKSTFLKDQAPQLSDAKYLTLDVRSVKTRAERQPDYFLDSVSEASKCVIIDEVQKVPDLFDALKASVDETRRPGRFIISGSTEFSNKSGIRESLTGRIGLLRLFPMTLAETNNRPLSTALLDCKFTTPSVSSVRDIERWLSYGGMPSHCFLRDQDEREASWNAWIETVCFRDLVQFKTIRPDGELARDILTVLAKEFRASIHVTSKQLKQDPRKIKRLMEAFEALFLVQKIRPHPNGVGKDEYVLWDTGFSALNGATQLSRLRTLLVNECLAQFEYAGKGLPKLFYFQSQKGSRCDLLVQYKDELQAFLLTDESNISPYIERTVQSIKRNIPNANVHIVAPVSEGFTEYGATIVPWTAIG